MCFYISRKCLKLLTVHACNPVSDRLMDYTRRKLHRFVLRVRNGHLDVVRDFGLQVFTRELVGALDENACNLVNGAEWPWLGGVLMVLEKVINLTIEAT